MLGTGFFRNQWVGAVPRQKGGRVTMADVGIGVFRMPVLSKKEELGNDYVGLPLKEHYRK